MNTVIALTHKIERIQQKKNRYRTSILDVGRRQVVKEETNVIEVAPQGYCYATPTIRYYNQKCQPTTFLPTGIYPTRLFKKVKEKEETSYHLTKEQGVYTLFQSDRVVDRAYEPSETSLLPSESNGEEVLRCYVRDIKQIRKHMERLNEDMLVTTKLSDYIDHIHIAPKEEGSEYYIMNTHITIAIQSDTIYARKRVSIPKEVIRLLLVDTSVDNQEAVIIEADKDGYRIRLGENITLTYCQKVTPYLADPTAYRAYENLLQSMNPPKLAVKVLEETDKQQLKEQTRRLSYRYYEEAEDRWYSCPKEVMDIVLKYFTQHETIEVSSMLKQNQTMYYRSAKTAIRYTQG